MASRDHEFLKDRCDETSQPALSPRRLFHETSALPEIRESNAR